MKIKLSEAIGVQLDELVARALGVKVLRCGAGPSQFLSYIPEGKRTYYKFAPSTKWPQGGPIIEREWLDVTPWPNDHLADTRWHCVQHDTTHALPCYGPTPLIAAMRCFVASRLGEEVEVPDELV